MQYTEYSMQINLQPSDSTHAGQEILSLYKHGNYLGGMMIDSIMVSLGTSNIRKTTYFIDLNRDIKGVPLTIDSVIRLWTPFVFW